MVYERLDVLDKLNRGTGIGCAYHMCLHGGSLCTVSIPSCQGPPEFPPTFLKPMSGRAGRPPAGVRPIHPT